MGSEQEHYYLGVRSHMPMTDHQYMRGIFTHRVNNI